MPQPTYERLSIVMPVYNEAATLRVALERVLAVEMPIPTELVVVDDGPTDGCTDLIADLVDGERVPLFRQDPNQGKGAALVRGFAEARGDLLTILDADLEHDPADIPSLCGPALSGEARGERIFEVPTSYKYKARGREEGKKIERTDGVEALWILAKIRLRARTRR